jgi:hypothetical protein
MCYFSAQSLVDTDTGFVYFFMINTQKTNGLSSGDEGTMITNKIRKNVSCGVWGRILKLATTDFF